MKIKYILAALLASVVLTAVFAAHISAQERVSLILHTEDGIMTYENSPVHININGSALA